MPEIPNEELTTPNQLASAEVGLSLVKQWQERKLGKLKFLRVGKKIYYSRAHLSEYFANCECNANELKQVA